MASAANPLNLINAMTPSGELVTVTLEQGRIASITPSDPNGTVEEAVDLEGRLLLPGLVEPHAHLDKALLANTVENPTGDLMGAIEAIGQAGRDGRLDPASVAERAATAIEQLVVKGVTTIRSHVDVGGSLGLTQLLALMEVRDRFASVVDLELVALTHSPVTGADGAINRAAIEASIEAGVDLVGGCPHLEAFAGASPDVATDLLVDMAAEAGIGLDLHMDETLDPAMASLDHLAKRVMETGFPYGVTASHCVSLSVQSLPAQAATAALLAEARIGVVALPQTNLYLQGRDHPVSTPRGVAPVEVLADAGVTVAAGGDNVQDPFNPLGSSDALDTAALMVLVTHRSPTEALAMVTDNARAVLNRESVGLTPGSPANLVAIKADSVREALASTSQDRVVIHNGQVVATTCVKTRLNLVEVG